MLPERNDRSFACAVKRQLALALKIKPSPLQGWLPVPAHGDGPKIGPVLAVHDNRKPKWKLQRHGLSSWQRLRLEHPGIDIRSQFDLIQIFERIPDAL
jgi:hypothetical protein